MPATPTHRSGIGFRHSGVGDPASTFFTRRRTERVRSPRSTCRSPGPGRTRPSSRRGRRGKTRRRTSLGPRGPVKTIPAETIRYVVFSSLSVTTDRSVSITRAAEFFRGGLARRVSGDGFETRGERGRNAAGAAACPARARGRVFFF